MGQIDATTLASEEEITAFKDAMVALTDRVMGTDTINPRDYESIWGEAAAVLGAPLMITENILPPGWIVAVQAQTPEVSDQATPLGSVSRTATGRTIYTVSVVDTHSVDPNDGHVFTISHPYSHYGAYVICAILAWTKVWVKDARTRMASGNAP